MKTLIIIPSRLSATRLPGKPLLKINDISIISHVFNKAKETNIGEVIVATEDQEIVNDVKKNGGKAILTSNKHKTGTDRIYEAYQKLNLDNIDFIMNLQGDEPAINIQDIINLNQMMANHNAQITLQGTEPTVLNLLQQGTINQTYSITNTCYTVGGCTVNVSQGN